jgi:MraZ protein
MLSGEHEHTLDEKNRLTLPARFRARFAEGLVLTRGIDGCLTVYTPTEFAEKVESPLAKLDPFSRESRAMERFYYANAVEAVPDKQGRIMIPQSLIQKAGLTREVLVIGVSSRLEIWDRATWRQYIQQVEENVEDAAQRVAAKHD